MSSFRKAFLVSSAIGVIGFVLSVATLFQGFVPSQWQGASLLLAPTLVIITFWICAKTYRSIAGGGPDPSIPLKDLLFQILVLGLLALPPGIILIKASLDFRFAQSVGLVTFASILGLGLIGLLIVSHIPILLVATRLGEGTEKQADDLLGKMPLPIQAATGLVSNDFDDRIRKRLGFWLKISVAVTVTSYPLGILFGYLSPLVGNPFSQLLSSASSFLPTISGAGLVGTIYLVRLYLQKPQR